MASRDSPREQAVQLREQWSHRPNASEAVWPAEFWDDCRSTGVSRWTIPVEFGGDGCPPAALLEGCLELARGQLLVTFILSQFQAACQRLAGAASEDLRRRWLPRLARGECFATVGISHLTTSRQHIVQPAVKAEVLKGGYRFTGEIPWVTGSRRADVLVIGGTLPDGQQILAAVPGDQPGIRCEPPLGLLALEGSETSTILLHDTEIRTEDVIAGPVPLVLQAGTTSGAGSLTTSALAAGHALACVDRLAVEAEARPNLLTTVESLRRRADEVRSDLLRAAAGHSESALSSETLRTRATELALHASQSLLTASKGAGFVSGHPAERLAREALFFLVWSCPQAVAGQLLEGFSACLDEPPLK